MSSCTTLFHGHPMIYSIGNNFNELPSKHTETLWVRIRRMTNLTNQYVYTYAFWYKTYVYNSVIFPFVRVFTEPNIYFATMRE